MKRAFLGLGVVTLLASSIAWTAGGCGGSDTASGGSSGSSHPSGSGASSAGGEGGTNPTSSGPSTSENGGGGAGPGGGGQGGASPPGDIGVWQDAPGACPAGTTKKDITTSAELGSASRGEDAYANDAPATCYFIHNGSYAQDPVILFIKKGGVAGGARRIFVGESRTGVVIHGRGSVDDAIGDVTISNLTFDLTNYQDDGAFNTMTLLTGKNITIDHVTFTGDCKTGALGGHIETNQTSNVLIEACLIEKFGRCGTVDGHMDHGIYLGAGKNITIHDNIIRGNSSRGIQMYTQGGEYGTLDQIMVDHNLIQENGHADDEDGIVINSYGTGPISNVTIERNLFVKNYFSGIRFAGGTETGVVVSKNTFSQNGAGSSNANRSEINADDTGGNAGAMISANIFDVGFSLMNNCYTGKANAFSIGGDFVHGTIPTGAKADCIGTETMGDPMFMSATDFHPTNAAAKAFGAYAP